MGLRKALLGLELLRCSQGRIIPVYVDFPTRGVLFRRLRAQA
jgi:hypothetical protein